ncbi:MAG: acetyltransferase [Sphingomonas bacterium]|uniref:arylamine N-acetyltransferase family protein n=1 Tax=Sphingomonas bacterium TaxID=1895847 RepID=UPI00262EF399|nr:arylamine N-acetyltransferase [Sphingomonas bacterium]MDB5696310.1 acetyltransferase [Sphingomonas bacterium]
MFDLDAYLSRIQLPARVTLDAEGLQRLQRAHRLAIPFENLDVALGRAIAIDTDAVFAKLVTARRGGFCFEHNRLFGDSLAALGFAARPLLARVWLNATATPPLNHAATLVTIEGQDWLADAGFGGSYSPAMPLVDGAESSAPDGARFRLEKDAELGWQLLRDGPAATSDGRSAGPGWQRQYSFTLDEVGDDDLAAGNAWACTSPDSRFTRLAVVSLPLPAGFASLTDRLYRRRAGDTQTESEITDPRVYRLRLSLMFGIDLTGEEVAALGLF